MNDGTEVQLVEAARNGNVESFGALYDRYYPAVVGVAYAMLGDIHQAEDTAQETFAIACRDLKRLRQAEKFAGWLRGICRNVAKGLIRSRSRRVELDVPTVIDESASKDGSAEAVRQAVTELPARAREVVLLHYFSGLSHEEIARLLATSPQAIHGRLVRARRKLAPRLSPFEPSGRQS